MAQFGAPTSFPCRCRQRAHKQLQLRFWSKHRSPEAGMESKAKLLGHPIHPMLIVFPLGLLATAVVFDIVGLSSGEPAWFDRSFWMIAAGIIGGLLAAIFGLIDWWAISAGTRAKAIGLWHGVGNVVVVLLFIASWLMRRPSPTQPSTV